MKSFKILLVLLIAVQSLSACKKDPVPSPVIPPVFEKTDYKVLFVGNSYTYYNDGVDYHLQQMLKADSSSDSINYVIRKIAVGAYTLEAHYADPLTITKIKSENWNTVVLQEQSTRPINNPELFSEYARYLDAEIKKVNAKTVLYMTWPDKDNPSDMDSLAASYQLVGRQLNAMVAPVGKVREYIQKTYPQIELYISDNKHPTLSGTYTAACVFYFSLLKKNPVENKYIPSGMSTENVVGIRKAVYDYIIQNP
ncbi:MAG: hypothetical protein Q7U54_09915 [Bacteroidales bacterium]|nr:hypothetical protein [Bacteroidales bacterium]